MAMQSIIGGLTWPGSSTMDIAATGLTGNLGTQNGLNDKCGAVFIAPSTVTVHKIGFYISTVTSFIGTADARIETVTASSGVPSETEVGTSTTFTPAASTWFWVTLTADASLTAGTAYWAGTKVTAFTSGSYTQFSTFNGALAETFTGIPYAAISTGTTLVDDTPIIALEDNAGNKVYVPGMYPSTNGGAAEETWASTSNPDRRGLRFKLPFPARLVGVRIYGDHDSDLNLILYDSDGSTALVTLSVDASIRSGIAIEYNNYSITPTSLTANTFYRLVILPTTTNSRINFTTISVDAAADLDCWPGGQNFHFTSANGAPANEAAWTQTLTKRPIGFELIFDQFDDGTGSSSIARIKAVSL